MNTNKGILSEIGQKTKQRIRQLKAAEPQDLLLSSRLPTINPKDFTARFKTGSRPRIIAEVKLASPSQGKISDIAPIDAAQQYLNNGATALSVLTEPQYFNGDIRYLREIRQKFPDAYLLMKDFFVDEYQLDQALWAGADAILIIMALSGVEGAKHLLKAAEARNLTPLVEVHNAEELEAALSIDASLIGINNRNLKDMTISLQTSLDLINGIPKDKVCISESGIETASDLKRLSSAGFSGFLIGTSLMRSGTPGYGLKKLLER